MAMKMSDVRALEQNVKMLEAAKRLDQEDIKGVTIQVIFDGPGRGQDIPVQMFVPADSPEFEQIMAVVRPQVDAKKTEAEAAVSTLSAKMANGTTTTGGSTPVTP
jgi:hypothetical protein